MLPVGPFGSGRDFHHRAARRRLTFPEMHRFLILFHEVRRETETAVIWLQGSPAHRYFISFNTRFALSDSNPVIRPLTLTVFSPRWLC